MTRTDRRAVDHLPDLAVVEGRSVAIEHGLVSCPLLQCSLLLRNWCASGAEPRPSGRRQQGVLADKEHEATESTACPALTKGPIGAAVRTVHPNG
jgi:hypothetical protein